MLYVDIETTGLDLKTDEILSLAIVDDAGLIVYETYLTPTRKTEWHRAQEKHGITPEFIRAGNFPTAANIALLVSLYLDNQQVVVYNMGFDPFMLSRTFPALRGNYWRCCMNRYAEFVGEPSAKPYHVTGYRTWKLTDAAERAGFVWPANPHSAGADALACWHVWQWLDEQAVLANESMVQRAGTS